MKNEIILSFGISGFNDISHQDLTELIGMNPALVFIKKQDNNDPVATRQNAWIMASDKATTASFEEQMNYFIDVLESKIDVFRPLSHKYCCEFSCAVTLYTGNGESMPRVHLNSRYNNISKALNLSFDFEIYSWPDDED